MSKFYYFLLFLFRITFPFFLLELLFSFPFNLCLSPSVYSNQQSTAFATIVSEALFCLCRGTNNSTLFGGVSEFPVTYCNAPGEIYKSHTLSNVFYNSSEGFSTPVTSPLMPPKPARTERKHYSWRNSSKREICMCIRILDPLELRNNSRKESMDENKRSMNYREAEYLFPGGKGMVTSWISDVTVGEQDGKLGRNKLVARQYEKTRVCLRSSAEIGYGKVVKSYNKMIAIIAFYFIIVTHILKGITYSIWCERKSTVGNSGRVSEDEGMRNCRNDFFYTILKCLSNIWGYKHRLWLLLIIYGLWRRYKVFKKKDKEIYQLTFRLVVARPWLRNLLLGNVFVRNVSVWIGSTGNTFMAGKDVRAYLCLYSDFWASCRIYLYRGTVILGLYNKFKSFYVQIYLYICKFLRLRLSCKWASYPLAFAVKLYTLVYFSSKASLLMIKSHKKYQSIDLIGLAPWEKAYAKNQSFLSHRPNCSDWRELRPLVTPWTWPIKEGTEPWKGQIGFSCLMSKVSLLPLSLSPLLLLLLFLLLFYYYLLCLCTCEG